MWPNQESWKQLHDLEAFKNTSWRLARDQNEYHKLRKWTESEYSKYIFMTFKSV